MSTRAQIRANVRTNLADAGITYYSEAEINLSLQDAYNDTVAYTLCHVKKAAALAWVTSAGAKYIDFVTTYGLTDYLGTQAIFNNVSNLWLADSVSLRDLDRLRIDWELWRGTPLLWCPHSLKYIVVAPTLLVPTGTFDLWYYANAPDFGGDNEAPIIAEDQHELLEWYATADMLETAEEPVKAMKWWDKYFPGAASYRERCHNLAGADLLLRI